jgi:hypothetical protein
MEQMNLIHDDIWSALRGLVSACGGGKAIGGKLWPAKGDKAAGWLDDCLNPDRQAKLCIEELFELMRIGRNHGFHYAKWFIDDVTFYERSNPSNPAERKAKLQEAFINAANNVAAIAEEIKICESLEAADSTRMRVVR